MAYITFLFMTALIFPKVSSQVLAIGSCSSQLLSLMPCGPFVQGFAQIPSQTCCDSLKQLYGQEPGCLCFLLDGNNTLTSAFPINRTLALELPQICSLDTDASICSGSNSTVSPSPNSPRAPISLGAKNNSTVAASPAVQVAPRQSIMGLGLGRSSGPETKIQQASLTVAAVFISILLL